MEQPGDEKPKGKRKEKRKGQPRRYSRTTSCLTLILLIFFAILFLILRSAPIPPPPVPYTAVVQQPTLLSRPTQPTVNTSTLSFVTATAIPVLTASDQPLTATPRIDLVGKIAFSLQDNDNFINIYVMDANGQNLRRVIKNDVAGAYLGATAWSPDGRQILYTQASQAGSVYIIEVDGSHRVALSVGSIEASGSWLSDGKHISYRSRTSPNASDHEVTFIANTDGSEARIIADHSGVVSPDGKILVYVATRGPYSSIYLKTVDGSSTLNLIDDDSSNYAPAWSPDSKQIAFISDRGDNHSRIYIVNADGSNLKKLSDLTESFDPSWSPDGKHIVFLHSVWGKPSMSLYIIGIDGTHLTKVFEAPWGKSIYAPVWGP